MENNSQENGENPTPAVRDGTNNVALIIDNQKESLAEYNESLEDAKTFNEVDSETSKVFDKKQKRFNLNIIPFLFAVILIVLFYHYVIPTLPKESFLQRLFLPDGKPSLLSTGVPLTALFFFLWSIFDMLLILRGVRYERKLLLINEPILTPIDISHGYFEQVDKSWKGSKMNRTFQRIYFLLEKLEIKNNQENIHEFFRYQSDLDTDKAASKYTFTKIAIWAMPILGFIGTVLGIGLAVGNFSNFLSHNIDDIKVIKKELSKVATGLSFAFYSTLFGLVLSMFAMFLTTFVQNLEDKYLTLLEETCFSIIEKFKVGDTIQPVTGTPAFRLDVDNIIGKFNSAIDAKVKQVLANISSVADQLEVSAKNITAEFAKIPLEANTAGLIKQLQMSATSISTEFAKVAVLMERNNEQFKATSGIISEKLDEMKKGFAEIAKKSDEFYKVDLGSVLIELVKTQNAILPVLETLTKPTEIIVTTTKR